MSPLPARAASLRGDDLQHLIALHYALQVSGDASLRSITVEDPAGGAFDDIVIRPNSPTASTRFIQVKAGVRNNSPIDNAWLTAKRSAGGRSTLQKFFDTWQDFGAQGRPFELIVQSNKGYDSNDPIMGLIDNRNSKIPIEALTHLPAAGPGQRRLQEWAAHLGCDVDTAIRFVADVAFKPALDQQECEIRCAEALNYRGWRSDPVAVSDALAMVRAWVTRGVGERTPDDIRAELIERNLRDGTAELGLAIHAIDYVHTRTSPHAEIDLLDLYEGGDPFERRALRGDATWTESVLPRLEDARKQLLRFGSQRLSICAAMRLPMYFAVGRTFARVANWTLTTQLRGVEWATDVEPVPASVATLRTHDIAQGNDLAVCIGLTHDPAGDVIRYVRDRRLPVGQLTVLSVPAGPSSDSVAGPAWSRTWVLEARELIRALAREQQAQRIHLFLAAPAGVALFLGHEWNMLPTTTVYEHLLHRGYAPTFVFRG